MPGLPTAPLAPRLPPSAQTQRSSSPSPSLQPKPQLRGRAAKDPWALSARTVEDVVALLACVRAASLSQGPPRTAHGADDGLRAGLGVQKRSSVVCATPRRSASSCSSAVLERGRQIIGSSRSSGSRAVATGVGSVIAEATAAEVCTPAQQRQVLSAQLGQAIRASRGWCAVRTAHELRCGELRVAAGVGRQRRERHHAAKARRLPPGHSRESNRENACGKCRARGNVPGSRRQASRSARGAGPAPANAGGEARARPSHGQARRSGGAVGVPEPPAHASAGSSSRAPCRGTLRANRRVRLHQARCA